MVFEGFGGDQLAVAGEFLLGGQVENALKLVVIEALTIFKDTLLSFVEFELDGLSFAGLEGLVN